jgi:crossover junction endodeoxyribonuclease RusA
MNITLRVFGTPAAQGSKRHVGGGRMVEMSKRIKPWREAVYVAAQHDIPDTIKIEGPVAVRITFLFERPKAHYGSRKGVPYLRENAPFYVTRTPDIDKCVRALLDPLTEVGIWGDDAQVVIVHAAKRYCATGERPGALVSITNSLVETR